MSLEEYTILDQLASDMAVKHKTRGGMGAVAAIWTLRKALLKDLGALPDGTKTTAEQLEAIVAHSGPRVHLLPETLRTDVTRSAARLLKDFTKPGRGDFCLDLVAKPSSWFPEVCPQAAQEVRMWLTCMRGGSHNSTRLGRHRATRVDAPRICARRMLSSSSRR